jgi:hypothetical protein
MWVRAVEWSLVPGDQGPRPQPICIRGDSGTSTGTGCLTTPFRAEAESALPIRALLRATVGVK